MSNEVLVLMYAIIPMILLIGGMAMIFGGGIGDHKTLTFIGVVFLSILFVGECWGYHRGYEIYDAVDIDTAGYSYYTNHPPHAMFSMGIEVGYLNAAHDCMFDKGYSDYPNDTMYNKAIEYKDEDVSLQFYCDGWQRAEIDEHDAIKHKEIVVINSEIVGEYIVSLG